MLFTPEPVADQGLMSEFRPLSLSLIHLIPFANQFNARDHSIQPHHGTIHTNTVQVYTARWGEVVSMMFLTAEVSRSGALPLVPFLAVSAFWPAVEAGSVQQVTEA